VDAVIISGDGMLYYLSERISDLVGQYRLPAIYPGRFEQQRNGLMSYGQNAEEAWRLSAKYVDRILRGAKPGELPIEQPTRIEFVINLRTAKALGLTIPPSLLLRADEVIQ
jgi:putative ABC transport system substrate-binding protein